jgi:hypothetical protein
MQFEFEHLQQNVFEITTCQLSDIPNGKITMDLRTFADYLIKGNQLNEHALLIISEIQFWLLAGEVFMDTFQSSKLK